MWNWIRISFASVILATSVILSAEQPSDWKPYHSIVGNFRVMLPGLPHWTGTNLSVPGSSLSVAYDSFLLEKSDQTVFLISVAHYPNEVDLSDAPSVLSEALEGLVASDPSHHLLGSEFQHTDQGFHCLRFHIQAGGSKTHLKGAQLLAGQQLLLAVVISESPQDLETDAELFLTSLTITAPKSAPHKGARFI